MATAKDRTEMAKAVMEMYDSLHMAVQEAGGSGASFAAENLSKMTVAELVGELAQNNIRFCYVGKVTKTK